MSSIGRLRRGGRLPRKGIERSSGVSALARAQGTGEFPNDAVLDLKIILIVLVFRFASAGFEGATG